MSSTGIRRMRTGGGSSGASEPYPGIPCTAPRSPPGPVVPSSEGLECRTGPLQEFGRIHARLAPVHPPRGAAQQDVAGKLGVPVERITQRDFVTDFVADFAASVDTPCLKRDRYTSCNRPRVQRSENSTTRLKPMAAGWRLAPGDSPANTRRSSGAATSMPQWR